MPFKKLETKTVLQKIAHDIFDEIELPISKEYVAPPKVTLNLSDDILNAIRSEVADLLKQQIESIVKETKPKIIQQTRVIEKTIQAPKETILKEIIDEEKLSESVQKEVKKATDALKKSGQLDVFIPAPTLIPSSAGQDNKVLSVKDNQLVWISQKVSASSYTTSNVTAARTLDADDTSLDELADVLGSLIADLKTAGLIQ